MPAPESERVDAYLNTIKRLEPDIAMIDASAAYASIAISLKRIADVLEKINEYGEMGFEAVSGSIKRMNR